MEEKTAIQEEEVNDAIHEEEFEDAEETESKDAEKPVLERDRLMEELSRKRREEKQREATQEESDKNEKSEKSDESDDDDEMIDLKVDGEIIKKTKKEVQENGGVAQMQKALSAEKRLHEATIAKRQAEELRQKQLQRERELERREKELRAKYDESKKKKQNVDLESVADKFLQSVYSGDEKEAKESLISIMSSLNKPTQNNPVVNESAILQKALFEVEKRNGQREFAERFPHLKDDKFFFDKTNYETIEIMKQNPNMSPRDVILEAAKRVDSIYKEKLGKGTELNDRIEKKKKIENIVPAQTRKKQEAGYKPMTKDDIFNMYRNNRMK